MVYAYMVKSSKTLMVTTEVNAAIFTKNTIEVMKKSPKKIGKNVMDNCEKMY